MRPVREARATPAPPRGLTAADIKEAAGCNARYSSGIARPGNHSYPDPDRRRRAEVLNLKAGNLTQEEQAIYYSYRGKGGKHGKRELPQPAFRPYSRPWQPTARISPP